jgi:cytochrome c-type biogenesis protein CcmH/NrfF
LGWGLSWIAVGAIILLNNLGVIAVGIQVLWPVVLVILGANLLLCGARRRLREFEQEGAEK